MKHYRAVLRCRFTATWEQGILTPRDQLLLVMVFCVQGIVRGIDYLTSEISWQNEFVFEPSNAHGVLQESLGVFFIGASFILLFSMALDRHIGIWLGHALFAMAYLTAASSVTWDVVRALFTDSVEDTLRVPGTLWIGFWFHLLHTIRTGIDPLSLDKASDDVEVADIVIEPRKGKHSG